MHATLGFCGRSAEMAVVAEAVEQARTGRPAVVVVTGEGGIGKSRLLREALAGVEPPVVVGVGAAVPALGATLPYGPWVPVIEDLLAAVDPDPTQACRDLGVDPAALASLLPGLSPSQSPGSASRLVPALVRVVRAASQLWPVVIMIDDLHWADEASLGVLTQLVTLLRTEQLCLLVATRPPGPDTSASLAEALDRLQRAPAVRDVVLCGLGERDADGLLDQMGVSTEARPALMSRAEGNPFLLAQLASAPAGGLPAPARRLLQERLRPLPCGAVLAVAVVGVAAVPMAFGEVAETLARLGVTDTSGAVDEALRVDVIRPRASASAQRLVVRHDLLAEAVVDYLSAHQLQRVNSALLVDAEAEDARWAPADLARFALGAGRSSEAFIFSVQAARAARAQFALRDAEAHLGVARGLWDATDPTMVEATTWDDLWLLSIRNAVDSRRLTLAHRLLDELTVGATTAAASAARVLRAEALIFAGHPDAAYAQASAALLDVGDDARRLDAISTMAMAKAYLGDPFTDESLVVEARSLARRLGDVSSLALAASVEASAATTVPGLLRASSAAAGLFLRAGDLDRYLESVSYMSVAMYLLGDDSGAVDAILTALDECEAAPPEQTVRRDWLAVQAAQTMLDLGRWDQARDLLEQAQHGEIGAPTYRNQVLGLLNLLQHEVRPDLDADEPESLWSQGIGLLALEDAFWSGDVDQAVAWAKRMPSTTAFEEEFGPRRDWLLARAAAEAAHHRRSDVQLVPGPARDSAGALLGVELADQAGLA
ncbi:MAG: ATP-binding protein, partial [Jiangellales bacterium]